MLLSQTWGEKIDVVHSTYHSTAQPCSHLYSQLMHGAVTRSSLQIARTEQAREAVVAAPPQTDAGAGGSVLVAAMGSAAAAVATLDMSVPAAPTAMRMQQPVLEPHPVGFAMPVFDTQVLLVSDQLHASTWLA